VSFTAAGAAAVEAASARAIAAAEIKVTIRVIGLLGSGTW
jgi:hypothetical protein